MNRDYEVKKSNKIYVSNLSPTTTESDLQKAFGKCGQIKDVTVKQKEAISFAFIEFESVEDAERAISEMSGKDILGNQIKVYFAKGGNERRGGFERGRGREGGYGGNRDFNGPPRRDFGDRPRGCFNCGEEGHMIKDCEKPRKPREFNREGGERGGYGGERGGYGGRGGDRGGYGGERGGYGGRGGDRGERGGYGGDRGDRGGYGGRGGDRGGYKKGRDSSSGSRSPKGGRDRRDRRRDNSSSSR